MLMSSHTNRLLCGALCPLFKVPCVGLRASVWLSAGPLFKEVQTSFVHDHKTALMLVLVRSWYSL